MTADSQFDRVTRPDLGARAQMPAQMLCTLLRGAVRLSARATAAVLKLPPPDARQPRVWNRIALLLRRRGVPVRLPPMARVLLRQALFPMRMRDLLRAIRTSWPDSSFSE